MAARQRSPRAARVQPLILSEAFTCLFEPHPIIGLHGGRGSAKSHSVGSALVARADAERKRIVCGREFQNSIAESVKELLDIKISELGLTAAFKSTDTKIEHRRNGGRITFIGLARNPQSVKSLEGCDLFWGEEAQTFSSKSLDILLPTIRKPGSQMVFTWNPEDPEDPVDKLLRGPVPYPGAYVREVSYLDNPWFYQTTLPTQMEHMRATDPQKHKHVWLGQYRRASDAVVFRNVRSGYCAVPDTARPMFGLDLGFAKDPNALVKVYALNDGKTLYFADELVGHGIPITDLPDWLDKMQGVRSFPITADSARPETIAHLNSAGFSVRGAAKGAGSVKEGVSWLQGKEIVISPDCPYTAREFKLYSWQTDRITGAVLPVLEDDNNHTIDAGRYAVEDYRKQTGFRVGTLSFGNRAR